MFPSKHSDADFIKIRLYLDKL